MAQATSEYQVSWEIDIPKEIGSPTDAASHALAIHRDPEGIFLQNFPRATCFIVKDKETGKVVEVDLGEDPDVNEVTIKHLNEPERTIEALVEEYGSNSILQTLASALAPMNKGGKWTEATPREAQFIKLADEWHAEDVEAETDDETSAQQ